MSRRICVAAVALRVVLQQRERWFRRKSSHAGCKNYKPRYLRACEKIDTDRAASTNQPAGPGSCLNRTLARAGWFLHKLSVLRHLSITVSTVLQKAANWFRQDSAAIPSFCRTAEQKCRAIPTRRHAAMLAAQCPCYKSTMLGGSLRLHRRSCIAQWHGNCFWHGKWC